MSNQLRIKIVDDKVIMPDSFPGIDVNNRLAWALVSGSSVAQYTATEDCIAYGFVRLADSNSFLLNGVQIALIHSSKTNFDRPFVLMKKGDVLKVQGYDLNGVAVFGLKY